MFNICSSYYKPFIIGKISLELATRHKNITCIRKVSRALTLDTLNPQIQQMKYAVRGEVLTRAVEIEEELKKGVSKPFKEVIRANLGDCHAMGQLPVTFIRQVLALVSYPKLLRDPQFPEDVKQRAESILAACRGGSVGSYSESPGIELIRRHVAEFIQKRDGGIPSDWHNIILGSGASDAIKNILNLFVIFAQNKKTGVMIPIPQYPLYSATLTVFNIHQIEYYLDEINAWDLQKSELERAVDEAKTVCYPRAIVIINPGNPTGQVLKRETIEEIIRFAYKEKLFILADEVYQENIWNENSKFYSFKRVATEMGEPYSGMEIASFMSGSKGYTGECGLRAGYVEVINMDPKVKSMYLKSITAMLCPTVLGQTVVDCIVNPPKPGEASYDSFMKEKCEVLNSLKIKAKMVYDTFNSFKGFSCQPVQGAMYAFPRITLPPKAVEEAKKRNMAPDVFYSFQLLEKSGVCVIPGTGFGQQPGTYHFRTTILPPTDKLKLMLNRFKDFHEEFMKEYF